MFKDILEDSNDVSLQEILVNLLDGEHDLDLKTHIFKPKQLSSLVILSSYLKSNQCKLSAKLIDDFVKKYLRYMVSYNRMSRTEIIKAVSSLMKAEAIEDKDL